MSRLKYVFALVGLAGCLGTPARQLSTHPQCPAVAAAEPIEEPGEVVPDENEPSHEGDYDVDDDDGSEVQPPAAALEPHPFADVTDEQLEAMLVDDPDALGAMSLGRPSAGSLFGGQQMQSSERWTVVNPSETWGTPETIQYLTHCIDRVNEQFPDTPVLPVGDIGRKSGGYLAPHVSHQSGRDVDVGYYYVNDAKWYSHANADNLDLPRTWAFVRAIITETDVRMIFIDRSIQALLRDYAMSIGESPEWLDQVFGGPSTTMAPIIRHEKGHATHIHVRFYNPIAQESGRRVYRMLIAHKMIKPPTYYVHYKVRSGDTLLKIARKNRTTVTALKKANRLRNNNIFAGRSYKIPRRGGVTAPKGPLVIPERRTPPRTPASVANAPFPPTGGQAIPASTDSTTTTTAQ